MASNQAAWLDGKDKKLRVGPVDVPKAGAGEIVVKVHAVAVNPVDWKVQDSGFFIKTWPTVLGTDTAGEVVEVGDGVERFKKGDRVAGHNVGLVSGEPADGAFQLYARIKAGKSAILPESISYTEGAVLPLALDTAAIGLFSPQEGDKGFGLSFPSLQPESSGKTVVVWGGSSSVGAIAIQLAVASGAKVVAVASSHNFDFCKKCGASEVYDYKKSSIVEDVVQGVKAVGGEFVGVYDAISLPEDSYKYTLDICDKLGGGSVAVVLQAPEKTPSGVKINYIFGVNDMTHPIWENYVTPALKEKKLQCLPEPMVVGKGLESIQAGLDANKKGVSAKKVVIEVI